LIKQRRLVPTPSQELDRILALQAPPAAKKQDRGEEEEVTTAKASDKAEENKPTEKGSDEERKVDYESYLLLKPHTITELVKTFNLEHQLSIELTRARQQTIKAIQKGNMNKLEEAAANIAHESEDEKSV
jgi:hypothetical protein